MKDEELQKAADAADMTVLLRTLAVLSEFLICITLMTQLSLIGTGKSRTPA